MMKNYRILCYPLCLFFAMIISAFIIKNVSLITQKDKIIVNPKEQIQSTIYENKKYITDYIKRVNYRMYPGLSDVIYSSIIRSSRDHKIDPVMLFSIINEESRFNPWVVSEANCIGLGQVHWNIWGKELIGKSLIIEKIELYDPKINIMCSSYIFKKNIIMSKGDVKKALRRYFGLLKSGKRSKYDIRVLKKREEYIKYVKSRRKGEKR